MGFRASVPVLTFVSCCGRHLYECQNQRDTSKYWFSSVALTLTFLRRGRLKTERNVRVATHSPSDYVFSYLIETKRPRQNRGLRCVQRWYEISANRIRRSDAAPSAPRTVRPSAPGRGRTSRSSCRDRPPDSPARRAREAGSLQAHAPVAWKIPSPRRGRRPSACSSRR